MGDKRVRLKDGSEVLVRAMRNDDLDRSFAFFQALSKEDRKYLRVDVTRRELVERRIRDIEEGLVRRIVALAGDKIVGDATLELSGHGWMQHKAELRLIVASEFHGKGLGKKLALELHEMAVAEKCEEIIARVMRPQKAALSILRGIGFSDETLLPDFVADRNGTPQDLMLMRCHLRERVRSAKP